MICLTAWLPALTTATFMTIANSIHAICCQSQPFLLPLWTISEASKCKRWLKITEKIFLEDQNKKSQLSTSYSAWKWLKSLLQETRLNWEVWGDFKPLWWCKRGGIRARLIIVHFEIIFAFSTTLYSKIWETAAAAEQLLNANEVIYVCLLLYHNVPPL